MTQKGADSEKSPLFLTCTWSVHEKNFTADVEPDSDVARV